MAVGDPIPQDAQIGFGAGSAIPADATVGSAAPASTEPPTAVYQRPAGTADAQISAQPNTFLNWLQNAEADVRYGGARTGIGKVLSTLGAQGTDVGSQAGAGGTLASPVLGPIHTAQGIAMTPAHPVAGPLKAAGGVLETASIPGMFAAGPAAEATANATANVVNKLPSMERAGQTIQSVSDAAGQLPVNTSGPMQIAQRINQLASRGGTVPKVVKDFLSRMGVSFEGETVTRAPASLTFDEGRDFYSNATRLSADEYGKLTKPVQRLVGQFTNSLHGALTDTADQVGMGQAYNGAIQEYANAASLARKAKGLGQYVLDQAMRYGPITALGYGAYKSTQK